jgi:hypothetical protein
MMNNREMQNTFKNLSLFFVVSLISGLFAWYLERFLSGITTLYFSYDLNIKAVFYIDGIHFLTPASASVWTRDAIVTLNLAAPIMNLFLGLFVLAFYVFTPRKSRSMAFFMIWLMIFSFTGIFGSYVENNLAHTRLYELSKVMHIGVVFQIIFAVLSLYFLYIVGLAIGKPVMMTLPDDCKKEDNPSLSCFLAAFIFPWILILFFSLKNLGSSLLFTYLLGIIILLPFNWMQEPEKRGVRLKHMPAHLPVDTFALVVYLFGMLLIRQMMVAGITL